MVRVRGQCRRLIAKGYKSCSFALRIKNSLVHISVFSKQLFPPTVGRDLKGKNSNLELRICFLKCPVDFLSKLEAIWGGGVGGGGVSDG